MQHGTSHFLRKSLESNAFRAKVTAVVYRDYFFLNVVKHNELQFFSSFEASTNEDLLYHLVFVLQQKELTNEEGNIELVSASQNQLKLDDAVEMLQKIKELSKYRASLNESFVSSSQALCV